MQSTISVLLTKEPTSSAVSLYKANPKTIQKVIDKVGTGNSAYIETIADLDNAHFVTKWEMQELTEKLSGMNFAFPPRDRLIAAKALALALLNQQDNLPDADIAAAQSVHEEGARYIMPQSQVTAVRRTSNMGIQLALLAKGTTMAEMQDKIRSKKGTPWTKDSILGGLNWDLNKRMGYGYKVVKKEGVDHYSLLLPQGVTEPKFI